MPASGSWTVVADVLLLDEHAGLADGARACLPLRRQPASSGQIFQNLESALMFATEELSSASSFRAATRVDSQLIDGRTDIPLHGKRGE
jgi:hypothetical protein